MVWVALALLVLVPVAMAAGKKAGRLLAANAGLVLPEGRLTAQPGEVIATQFLLVTRGSPADEVDICAADELPLGVCQDTADADDVTNGEPLSVRLLGSGQGTDRCVASEAIAQDADLYTAAGGKVQNEPATAGTYYKVGKALEAATGDDSVIAFEPCAPVKLVVIAALTSTDGTAAAAADLAALKAEAEKIGDDVRAIAAALATPALVKVLAA